MFAQLGLGEKLGESFRDVPDKEQIERALAESQAEIIFRLSAQPLVRRSYRDPPETFATNVMGSANLLQAVRSSPSVKAVVVVTSDKCYENSEWGLAVSRGGSPVTLPPGIDPTRIRVWPDRGPDDEAEEAH
jgi:CDP-glucose 4,6-dehydratase